LFFLVDKCGPQSIIEHIGCFMLRIKTKKIK